MGIRCGWDRPRRLMLGCCWRLAQSRGEWPGVRMTFLRGLGVVLVVVVVTGTKREAVGSGRRVVDDGGGAMDDELGVGILFDGDAAERSDGDGDFAVMTRSWFVGVEEVDS